MVFSVIFNLLLDVILILLIRLVMKLIRVGSGFVFIVKCSLIEVGSVVCSLVICVFSRLWL